MAHDHAPPGALVAAGALLADEYPVVFTEVVMPIPAVPENNSAARPDSASSVSPSAPQASDVSGRPLDASRAAGQPGQALRDAQGQIRTDAAGRPLTDREPDGRSALQWPAGHSPASADVPRAARSAGQWALYGLGWVVGLLFLVAAFAMLVVNQYALMLVNLFLMLLALPPTCAGLRRISPVPLSPWLLLGVGVVVFLGSFQLWRPSPEALAQLASAEAQAKSQQRASAIDQARQQLQSQRSQILADLRQSVAAKDYSRFDALYGPYRKVQDAELDALARSMQESRLFDQLQTIPEDQKAQQLDIYRALQKLNPGHLLYAKQVEKLTAQVDAQKQQQATAANQAKAALRQVQVRNLESAIKRKLFDPRSYHQLALDFTDLPDGAQARVQYESKDAYGATKQEQVLVRFDASGKVLGVAPAQ